MKRLIAVLLLIANPLWASTVYVNNSCANSGDGTTTSCAASGGAPGAFNSIANITSGSYAAGNTIDLQAQTYRELMSLAGSGSSGNVLTIQNGTIYGSNSASSAGNWTEENYSTGTPAFVGGAISTTACFSSGTCTLNYSSTAGHLLAALVCTNYQITPTLAVSDSNSVSWTAGVKNASASVSQAGTCQLFFLQNAAAITSITATQSGGGGYNIYVTVGEYSNLATTGQPRNAGAGANGNSGSLDSGAITTVSGDLVLGGGRSNGTGFAASGSWTLPSATTIDTHTGLEYQVASGTSLDATATAGSNYWVMMGQPFIPSTTTLTLWYASASVKPNWVFRDGVPMTQVATKAAIGMTYTNWWWDATNSRVYTFGTDASTPPTSGGHVFEAPQRNYCVDLNGKSYSTLSNLTCKFANAYGITSAATGSSHVTFNGVTSSYNFNSGIAAQACSNFGSFPISYGTVENSTLAWNGASGIDLDGGSSNWTIGLLGAGNTINNNTQVISNPPNTTSPTWCDNTGYSGGVRIYSAPGVYSLNDVVQYNKIYSNGVLPGGSRIHDNGSYNGGVGIWFDTIRSQAGNYTDSDIARYNQVYDNTTANLKLEHTGYAQFYGNSTANAYGGSSGVGDEIQLSDYTHTAGGIYNNKVVNNSMLMYPTERSCIIVTGPATLDSGSVENNSIENNSCSAASTTTESLIATNGAQNDGTVGSGNAYDNNNLGVAVTNFITWGATQYSTVTAWQSASSQTGNLSANPLYNNAGALDLSIPASSPNVGAGLNLGSAYSIGLLAGSAWPGGIVLGPQCSAWNIGAYVQANCSNPFWYAIP